MLKKIIVLSSVVLLFVACAKARAELLFSDSYNTSVASMDVNFEIDARTGGIYGGAGSIGYNTYAEYGSVLTVGVSESSRTVLEMNNRQFVWLDHNFNGSDSAGGVNVAFTAKSTNPNDDANWYIVGIAGPDGDSLYLNDRPLSNGLCIIFRGNGEGVMRENNVNKETFTWISGGNDQAYHDFLIEVTGIGDNNPFDGNGAFRVKVYRDGGTTPLINYVSTITGTNNYIGLEHPLVIPDGIVYPGYRDSLSITRIPEPSTLLMLAAGLIGLMAYTWMKRK